MDLKASLDPQSRYLSSWTPSGNPCDGSFEGLACNENGQVANISLQGKGLSGKLSPAIGGLKHLTGLYLHYNALHGEIPREIADLPELILQLCYNQLKGSIPTQLGDLKKLSVLALQSNQLTGAIPASLGDLGMLTRLDLSSNRLFGSIPTRLADASSLQVLDVRNNTLSGNVPPVSAIGILTFVHYRRRKQKLGNSYDVSDSRLSTDQAKGMYRKNGSPLISLEYSNGWDPLADSRNFNGESQDVFQSFRFNLEEVETATQYFSESNLLGKSNFSATYKGVLRDGSVVAVKSISKSSCKSDEAEFLKGLNILTSLRNENLARLRGFCCSRGRGECFLVYDFVPNGNLSRYLDVKEGDGEVLEWTTRVSIVKGIAKGIAYLHAHKPNKPALVHQNISAEKVLIDQRFNPLLVDSGLCKILTNDVVFSALKASAARGYLAPEYTTTGRFTEKSDVYAFGVLLLQILSGKQSVTSSMRLAAESFRLQEFMDPNLQGRFFEYEAAKLSKMALLCSHESPFERPSMEAIVQELGNCSSCM
ncbi:Protein NSP-INTERACTING KINASE 2 [Senna tora]|uniref:Protein NSP-INTERACTING KINASE 2 n=1 Tax=Senna tora TaxID=362788 RepID=A0A834TNC2_9FABA|nr:Protein NSP-INTERACTING KINASE 2 [Senna tora]